MVLVSGYTDPRNTPAYVLGLDLGQSVDYSALAVLEEPAWIRDAEMAGRYFVRDGSYGWTPPHQLAPTMLEAVRLANAREGRALGGRPPRPPLPLVRLHRWDLGTPYPRIVRDVGALLEAPPLADRPCILVVDRTGVGAGVVDLFRDAQLWPVPVFITGGNQPHFDHDQRSWNVPKRDLLGAALAMFQSKRLPLVPGPLTDVLVQELREMRLKINIATGRDTYEPHRSGQHDDLTLAVALACWFREYQLEHIESDLAERWNAPPADDGRDPSPPTLSRRSSHR